MYIANKADSRLFNGSSSLQPRRSFCFGYLKNGSAVPKQKLRLLSGRTSQTFEMPYLPYTSTLRAIKTKTLGFRRANHPMSGMCKSENRHEIRE